ncbi:tetratricopeptide repeat protein [bacterium]|nr:tetratricopeptide repeat protein [bacterium]
MKIRFLVLSLGIILCFPGCAPTGPDPVNLAMIEPQKIEAAAVRDSLAFQRTLQQTLEHSAARREARRRQAEEIISYWRDFEQLAAMRRTRSDLPLFLASMRPDNRGLHIGLAKSVKLLENAVALDSTFAEAWAGLGHLRLEIGDRTGALADLEKALASAKVEATSGRPLDHDTLLQAHRDRCWALRELARWDEGLAAANAGLTFHHGDPDLLLVKGLLLAGAGRYSEATALAVRLPAFEIRRYGSINNPGDFRAGQELVPSDYASRWIRSQASLAEDGPRQALQTLGRTLNDEGGQSPRPNFLKNLLGSARMPHHSRFWNDVGLVGELAGDPDFALYYAEAFHVRDYRGYYPDSIHLMGPLVLGIPLAEAPCYLSYGSGFHLGGSPFAYVAAQMDIMSLALFPDRKLAAARQALNCLEILDRRGLMPDLCHALRGRIFYRQGKLAAARKELETARDAFRTRDKIDARTSLLLGVLALDREEYGRALTYLTESAQADSSAAVTWRSRGIALAQLGRTDQALRDMTRALFIEPGSLVGHYNRGLLYLQMKRYEEAVADLDRAWRLDPENQDTRRLLQTAAAALREEGASPLEHDALALADDPRASLPPGVVAEIPSDLLLDHLERELEGFLGKGAAGFTEPDQLGVLCNSWELAYRENPSPYLRKLVALARLDLGNIDGTREILGGFWGKGLEPDEELMLLFADQQAGQTDRARELAERILAGDEKVDSPYAAALAAMAVAAPDNEGGTATDQAVIARWIDHNGETAGHSLRQWAALMDRGFTRVRQNYTAPLDDRPSKASR